MPYCTRAEVKLAKGWVDPAETKHDALIDQLLDDVASHVDLVSRGGNPWTTTAFTEYLDGGAQSVVVQARPIISVTSVYDDPSHGWGATTLIASTDYFTELGRGIIHLNVGRFIEGSASVKVAFSGGYATAPKLLRRLAVDMCVEGLNRASAPEVVSVGNKDGNVSKVDFSAWDDRILRRLRPLMQPAVA